MKNALGQFPRLEINLDQFQKILHAKKVLRNALFIEEKFEILLSNFIELKTNIEQEALETTFILNGTYSVALKQRLLFERRLANLLTSTKTYVDQVPSKVRDCFVDNDGLIDKVKSYFHLEYDSSLQYRFMEMLRNHVQHNGIAINLVSLNLGKHNGSLVNSILLYSFKSDLAQNKKNKKETINELPEKIDILESCQNYISSMGRIHKKFRNEIKDQVSISRNLLEDKIHEYAKLCDPLGLNVFSENDGDIESFPILLDWDNVRLELMEKNKNLEELF